MESLQNLSPILLALAAIIGAISGFYGVIKGNRIRLEESNKSTMQSTISAVNILMAEKDKFYKEQLNSLQDQLINIRSELSSERIKSNHTVQELQIQVDILIKEGQEKDVTISDQNKKISDLTNQLQIMRKQIKEI